MSLAERMKQRAMQISKQAVEAIEKPKPELETEKKKQTTPKGLSQKQIEQVYEIVQKAVENAMRQEQTVEFSVTKEQMDLLDQVVAYLCRTEFINPNPKNKDRNVTGERYKILKGLVDNIRKFAGD